MAVFLQIILFPIIFTPLVYRVLANFASENLY